MMMRFHASAHAVLLFQPRAPRRALIYFDTGGEADATGALTGKAPSPLEFMSASGRDCLRRGYYRDAMFGADDVRRIFRFIFSAAGLPRIGGARAAHDY